MRLGSQLTIFVPSIGVFILILLALNVMSSDASKLPTEDQSITEADTAAVKQRSQLELRWSIADPKMTWDGRVVHLDYDTSDWVEMELLGFQLYEFECKHVLEDSPVSAGTMRPLADADGLRRWRLSLELDDSKPGGSRWSSAKKMKFCVRFMLRNLPPSNENSVEVNFSRSQLTIDLDQSAIMKAKMTKPEDPRIQVNLPGSARAKVYSNEKDEL